MARETNGRKEHAEREKIDNRCQIREHQD